MKTQALAARINQVKAKARFDEVAKILKLDTNQGGKCPKCKGYGLKPCHEGKGWYCELCTAKGDFIGLVKLVRGGGTAAAVKFLEDRLQGCRDTGTLNLFSMSTENDD